MGLSEKDIAQQKQEVTVLKLFKHPHVVTVYDDFADEDNVFIVMEYCSRKKHQDNIGGDLL
jgi:serine/threonine protein kinase